MKPLRRHLRPVTWVALVAMWVLALLPTVSHALAAQRGQTWVEVCSVRGLERVALNTGADEAPLPTGATSHLVHCPLCQIGHTPVLLPSAPQALPAAGPAAAGPLPWVTRTPAATDAWPDARPRAPPLAA